MPYTFIARLGYIEHEHCTKLLLKCAVWEKEATNTTNGFS